MEMDMDCESVLSYKTDETIYESELNDLNNILEKCVIKEIDKEIDDLSDLFKTLEVYKKRVYKPRKNKSQKKSQKMEIDYIRVLRDRRKLKTPIQAEKEKELKLKMELTTSDYVTKMNKLSNKLNEYQIN